MKHVRLAFVAGSLALLLLGGGCAPRKQVTERDRKEAAHLVSEAQFAMTIREWPRAEGLLSKAVQLVPEGDYLLTLGGVRMRQKNREGAREAYQSALKAFELEAARNDASVEPWLKKAFVLGLLGRKADSRTVITNAQKKFPNDAKVRAMTDPKEFERLFSGQNFKDMAL